MISESPRSVIIATDMYLSHSVSNGIMRTMYAIDSVNIEKLIIMPSVTPSGRRLPPVAAEERTMGRIGQMQGAAMVTSPDKKANSSKIVIIFLVSSTFFFACSCGLPYRRLTG